VAAVPSIVVAVVASAFGAVGLVSTRPAAVQHAPSTEGGRHAAVAALAPGTLLIAARHLPDPHFAHAVILLADLTHDGAVGLVVNRPSEVTLASVFPQLMPTVTGAGHAFAGGPVERTHALALVRGLELPAGARRIVDGVHLVASREALEAMIASGAASGRLRLYLGYAGWGAGQLERETAQGVWHVLAGDAEAVFDPRPESVWPRLIARTDVIEARSLDGAPTRPPSAGAQLADQPLVGLPLLEAGPRQSL
jgi:putative transcriptional regulator